MIGWALFYAACGLVAGWSARGLWDQRETIVTMSKDWLKARKGDT